MDRTEFDRLFDDFTEDSFRLEALPQYNMGDLEGVAQFMSGDYLPTAPYPGVKFTRDMVTPDRRTSLVRLLSEPLSAHERYCVEWVYPHHADAGREIMLLPATSALGKEAAALGDFWMFDNATVVRMRYDDTGYFLASDILTETGAVRGCVEFRERLVAEAEPFRDWLARWRQRAI